MIFDIETINRHIAEDAEGFVEQCEKAFESKIEKAAEKIIGNMANSHIVLLSGPSSSGKTTTAIKIGKRLSQDGITAKIISLDNYFKDVDENTPRNEKGEFDFESPDCVDFKLLDEHFRLFGEGKNVRVPVFDFHNQIRSRTEYENVRIGEKDVIIFEGIHALNDRIAGEHPEALGIFVCVLSEVDTGDGEIFSKSQIRLMRRSVRDAKFRGAGAEFTLSVWENVLEGEKKYINPFKNRAKFEIDSFMPYEINLLKDFIKPSYENVESSMKYNDERFKILQMLEKFKDLDSEIVPNNSLIREFIGDSVYSY